MKPQVLTLLGKQPVKLVSAYYGPSKLGFSRRYLRPSKVALQLASSNCVMAIRNGKVNLLGFVLPAGCLVATMHDRNSGFKV